MEKECGDSNLLFSPEQVGAIGNFLGLPDERDTEFAAQTITIMVFLYRVAYQAKKKMGPVEEIRGKLARIADAAATLADLLADEVTCGVPDGDLIELAHAVPELKHLIRQPLWKDKSKSLEEVRELVQNISTSSGMLAGDDTLLRGYYFLLPLRSAKNNLETAALWPQLFIIWEQHGNSVGGSVNGTNPLHRFIKLVHSAAGLAEPSLNTLNRAIQRWKKDSRRSRNENKAWYCRIHAGNLDTM